MNCSVSSLMSRELLLSRRDFLQRFGAVALVVSAVRPTDAAAQAVVSAAGANHAADCGAPVDPTYYMDPGWSA